METEVQVKTSEPSKPTVKTIRHRAADKDRVPWQRLALSLFGILIIAIQWRWGVFHLYSLPPASYSAFSSMTNNASYVTGAIVIFMITGKLVYDWKNQTTSTVVEQASNIFERREEKKDITITEKVDQRVVDKFAEKYKDDPSYRPIDTVPDLNVGNFR